jgi:hypothetical protein
MEHAIIAECKEIITHKTLSVLQAWYDNLMTEYDWAETRVDWPYIFQKIYIHACLKKKRDMADWLEALFKEKVDPINQIAYKHSFTYGRHLLRKA